MSEIVGNGELIRLYADITRVLAALAEHACNCGGWSYYHSVDPAQHNDACPYVKAVSPGTKHGD